MRTLRSFILGLGRPLPQVLLGRVQVDPRTGFVRRNLSGCFGHPPVSCLALGPDPGQLLNQLILADRLCQLTFDQIKLIQIFWTLLELFRQILDLE